jgi:hypothetical protein
LLIFSSPYYYVDGKPETLFAYTGELNPGCTMVLSDVEPSARHMLSLRLHTFDWSEENVFAMSSSSKTIVIDVTRKVVHPDDIDLVSLSVAFSVLHDASERIGPVLEVVIFSKYVFVDRTGKTLRGCTSPPVDMDRCCLNHICVANVYGLVE